VPATTTKGAEVTATELTESVRWLTYTQQVRRLYGLSRTTTWRATGDGHLKVARIGRSVRIRRESLEAFMREHTIVSK
jgi:excisionase family DNA binding protein